MAEGKNEWWATIIVAMLSSTVPAYLSYRASQQDVRDVAPVSVDAVREQLDPAIKQLSDQVFELSRDVGRLEGRLERTAVRRPANGNGGGEASSSAHTAPAPAEATPDASPSPAPAQPARVNLPAKVQLPPRPTLTKEQTQLRKNLPTLMKP